jgi:tRNA(Ile)-lysidine synthase
MSTDPVYQQFETFMEDYVPEYRRKKYVLAVSGGMDSTLLMHLFKKAGLECIVAHCNYHLRGEDSNADETFAREEAEKLGFRFFHKSFDTLKEKEEMLESIQIVARKLRYTWFESLLLENQYDYVCTAHHQRDNIETLVQHFMHGAYPESMQGIKPSYYYLLRPLLYIPYTELKKYCETHEIKYRVDSSNMGTTYLRNKIRHKILPALEEVFGENYQDNLESVANRYKHYFDFLHQQASQLVEPAYLYEEINIDKLRSVFGAPALLYEALKDHGFNFGQCESICINLERKKGAFFESHDRSFKLFFAGDTLQLIANKPAREEEITLKLHDTTPVFCNGQKLSFKLRNAEEIDFRNAPRNIAYLNYDLCVGKRLIIDRWDPGNWFIPFGMKARKKVSDFLTDTKLSPAERYLQQVLKVDEAIAWIVGHRMDERFRVNDDTKMVLICELN